MARPYNSASWGAFGSSPILLKPAYSMSQLKDLRASSGAPIVECKKALEAVAEENDVLQAALDWLRKHGAAKASSKVADRETTEGLVSFASANEQSAVLVKVASETDFAGRSDTFVQLIDQVTMATLPSATLTDATTMELSKEDIASSQTTDGKTVQQLMDEAIVAIRENISVAEVTQLSTGNDDTAQWVGYIHNRIHNDSNAGTAAAAVLVAPASADANVTPQDLTEIGKKLAMHVVAARPQYLQSSEIPESVVEKEREILQQQIVDSGKAPEIAKKIVMGRLNKFFAEICMLDQGHMVEEKNPKIKDFLKARGVVLKQFKALFI
eukprot:CAMPEP_0172473912 /NCGR_PEP_ID=MMETSP1065-20121228/69093_1 /TAXON_ID=265537 /ORGANISM="Amphiprora paludosa, Strain CCMP125" /LENGTH=325 /DNA_ID=CAMNT_0013232089 /DNA_START=45 /DNA_END=1022 /DNA_ORIENTATION=+